MSKHHNQHCSVHPQTIISLKFPRSLPNKPNCWEKKLQGNKMVEQGCDYLTHPSCSNPRGMTAARSSSVSSESKRFSTTNYNQCVTILLQPTKSLQDQHSIINLSSAHPHMTKFFGLLISLTQIYPKIIACNSA